MSPQLLPPDGARTLRARPATAPETLSASPGYTSFHHSRTLRRTDFDGLAADVLAWQLQERSGMSVQVSEEPLRVGTVLSLRIGDRVIGLDAPCRVIEVIDEVDRRGFTYVTLKGHPESGVECFELRRDEEGRVTLHLHGFSRPGTWYARLAPCVVAAFQRLYTRRYLEALDRR